MSPFSAASRALAILKPYWSAASSSWFCSARAAARVEAVLEPNLPPASAKLRLPNKAEDASKRT